MQFIAERHEEPTAIRTNLGAIFVSLELSRSTWLITSLSPGGGEKMSKHSLVNSLRTTTLFRAQSRPPFEGWDLDGLAGVRVLSASVFEAPACVAGLDNIAVMGQTIEHGGGHFGVAEHLGPIGEGEVGSDQ
jgi:hypothetical protein